MKNLLSTPFRRRTGAVVATAVVLALVAGTAFQSRAAHDAKDGGPHAAPVTVATVLQKKITEWDEFSGRVEAIEEVEIRPRVAGTIDAIHFHEGQLVRKGDRLFTIDPRPYQAELARAQATLDGAQAKLALAHTELERTKRMIDEHAVAQRELDERENAVRESAAEESAAQASVLTAKLNLEYTEIVAPVSGRVSRAELTVGNLVGSGPASPALTRVVSVNPMYVNFEVDEQTYLQYAAHGAAGNSGVDRIPVQMGLANELDFPRTGHLQSIDNRIDTTSGTIRVRAVFDNANGSLTPGEFARVRTGGSAQALSILVDDRAIGTDQDKKFVFVVGNDSKANYREVHLGPIVDGLRVVHEGLQPGETIIVDGLQRVRPNDTVAPSKVAMDERLRPAGTLALASAKKSSHE